MNLLPSFTTAEHVDLLDDLPVSVYVKDRDHRFVWVNKATARALHLNSPREAIGKTDFAFFDPARSEDWQRRERRLLDGEIKVIEDDLDQEIPINGAKRRHFIVTCKYPRYDAQGNIAGLVGISKNIDRQGYAIWGAQVGLWYRDYLSDTAWYSPQWKKMLGYEDHEIENKSTVFKGLVDPEDWHLVKATCDDYHENHQNQSHFECEFRMVEKTGERLWIKSRGRGEFSKDGTLLRFAGSHENVTNHRDLKELHESILDNIPEFIFIKDAQKRHIYVNPTIATFLKTTKEDIEERKPTDRELGIREEEAQLFEVDDDLILNGKKAHVERVAERLTTGGETKILQTSKRLLSFPSRAPERHVLGVSTDITWSLEKEREQQKILKSTLEGLTAAIIAIEEARSIEDACLEALAWREAWPSLPVGQTTGGMISLLEVDDDGGKVVVANPEFASGIFKSIQPATRRSYDEPDEELDLLPWVLKHGEPAPIANSQIHPRCEQAWELCRSAGLVAQYVVPLQSASEKYGTMQFATGNVLPTETDLEIFNAVGAALSLTIERFRNQQELNDQLEELKIVNLALNNQYNAVSRAEITTILAHDLFHKAMTLTEQVRDLHDQARKALRDNRSPDHLDKLKGPVEDACLDLEGEVGKLRAVIRNDDEKETDFDVAEVIKETAITLERVMSRLNIRLNFLPSGKLPLRGLRDTFGNVFFNLIRNSIDAQKSRSRMQSNTIQIRAQIKSHGARRTIEIQYWDEGPGISSLHFPEIQDIFKLGSTSKGAQGTGTGLSVSRSLLTRFFRADLTIKSRKPPLFEIVIPI